MKYYLDCEFDGLGGELISMALVREDGYSFYAVMDCRDVRDPWVRKNVMSILFDAPLERINVCGLGVTKAKLSSMLDQFFAGDRGGLCVIADWPDDIRYLCDALITGPGTMIDIPGISFRIVRVDAYPTQIEGAIRHNAWWDAVALRDHLELCREGGQ